jgi:multisubunit Na+/H+ antiporter MnhF subunit
MTIWLAAVVAFLIAFAVPVLAAARGGAGGRFVAVQMGTAIATPLFVLMTFAFDQPALIDLALALALLSLPGTLLLSLFLERWL